MILCKQKRSHISVTPWFSVSGYQDSNLGPPAPKAGALAGLRYAPITKPLHSFLFVGVAGFEPATPCSQSRCASRTALCPDKIGGEGGIRTPGSLWGYDSLANCWFQPLTHLSVFRGFASAKVHLFFISPTLF